MQKQIVCTIIALLLCQLNSWGNGLFIYPGVKANNMGGAFISIADDETAIYWNPAGLTQLEKNGAEISAFYVSCQNKSNKSFANADASTLDVSNGDFPIFKVYPSEPQIYNNTNADITAFVPFAAGHTKINDITLSIGYYVSGGGGGKWEDTVNAGIDTLSASFNQTFGFIIYNLSAAMPINNKLSAGLGVDFVSMFENTKIEKSYIKNIASPFPSYNISIKKDSAGIAPQFVGGLLYSPVEKLKIGAVLRTGTIIKLTGKSTLTSDLSTLPGSETDFEEKYYYPMTYGVGVSYLIKDNITAALGINRENYSSLKEDITYKNPSPLFQNTCHSRNWIDVTLIHFGIDYKYNKITSFRCGAYYEPVPLSQDKLTLANTNQYNNVLVFIGGEYLLGPCGINLNVSNSYTDKPETDGRNYEMPSTALRLGVNYKF